MAESTHSAPNNTAQPYNTEVPTDQIEVAEGANPRRRFDEQSLQELADSIREHGVLQPLLVRRWFDAAVPEPRYRLVAGERRLRAAKLAGLERVPVRVLGVVDDATALRLALVENLQREDLDPLEVAEGYQKLQELGWKQKRIADAVARSQPVVANTLRLLKLPSDVREQIRSGALTAAHGVALARFADHPAVASAYAELAVQRKLPSGSLESGMPYAYDLETRGVIRSVDRARHFDTSVCRQCPFDALRSASGYGSYCLRPEHFDQLEAEGLAKREADAEAEALARGQTEGLIRYDELTPDAFALLDYGAPPGCAESCEHRKLALSRSGRLVPICVNPAHYQELERQAKQRKARETQESRRPLVERVEAAFAGEGMPGRRELAVLVAAALRHSHDKQALRAAAKRHAPDLDLSAFEPEGYGYNPLRRAEVATLARLEPTVLLRLGAEAVLRARLHGKFQDYQQRDAWADWYLGVDKATEPAPALTAAEGADAN